MSQIRRNSIKGTIWIYTGFLVGALNTYFFTHKSWFTLDQYGLTRSLLEVGMLIFAFSTAGTSFFLYKFFPYYQDNLDKKDNDLLGLALKISFVGFLLTTGILYLMEPLIIRKFSAHSGLLVEYFYLTIPMAFFLMLYTLLEGYSYGFGKGVTTNMLKETILRLFTLVITVLKIFDIINLKIFLLLFSLQYALITIILGFILYKEGKLWVSFKTSRVTRKYRKKIIVLLSLTFMSLVVTVLRSSIDGIVLAAKQNLGRVAIFGFASYLVTIMQAPLRSVVSITIPVLSREWKQKNIDEIKRIYQRSSINLLTSSLFIFFLILLNFNPAVNLFNLNQEYSLGLNVFILLGIVSIIEMGTGVNGQIIGTSVFWRFELWTNLLLTALIIPLSYLLTVKYGLVGPAIANLISFTVYNSIRYWFLLKKFNMQPFSKKTIEVFLIAIASYVINFYLFATKKGFNFIIIRSVTYSLIFIVPVYLRNISPDLKPIINTAIRKIRNIRK